MHRWLLAIIQPTYIVCSIVKVAIFKHSRKNGEEAVITCEMKGAM
jgi:hypothetical protein